MGSSVRSRPGRKLVQACFGMAKAYLGFLVTLETPVDIQLRVEGKQSVSIGQYIPDCDEVGRSYLINQFPWRIPYI